MFRHTLKRAGFTLCLLLSACGESSAPSADADAPAQEMVYKVTNKTGKAVGDVVLYGKGLGPNVGYGDIASGATESLTNAALKLPQTLHVDWTAGNGQRVYQKVNLWKALGDTYTGKVHLTLKAGPAVAVSK